MESLTQILELRIREEKYHNYLLGGVSSISHLFFADDILLFGQEDFYTLETVKEALHLFSTFTCMVVNRAKTGIVFLKAVTRS